MFTDEKFVSDLKDMTDIEVIRKYLYSTDIWYFSVYHGLSDEDFNENIDLVYQLISKNLDISMKNILIVGSAKTGFSIAPHKYLKKFDIDDTHESDIDIAIVSEKYFLEFWSYARKQERIQYQKNYNDIASGIYKGFIAGKAIENVPEIRKFWDEKVGNVKKVLVEETKICHPVNFRFYRTWEDLEDYHCKGIMKLKIDKEVN